MRKRQVPAAAGFGAAAAAGPVAPDLTKSQSFAATLP
jgi:hypothetical protein